MVVVCPSRTPDPIVWTWGARAGTDRHRLPVSPERRGRVRLRLRVREHRRPKRHLRKQIPQHIVGVVLNDPAAVKRTGIPDNHDLPALNCSTPAPPRIRLNIICDGVCGRFTLVFRAIFACPCFPFDAPACAICSVWNAVLSWVDVRFVTIPSPSDPSRYLPVSGSCAIQ